MKKFTFLAKVSMLTFVMSLITLTGISQTHFTPAVNNGAGNWHFYPVYAALQGVPLVAGDEIAIFDGNVCVGARTLTAALDSSYNLAVGNDFISYEKNGTAAGYNGGDSYSWRCWDASAGVEYTGTMTYNALYSPQDYTGSVFPATMEYRWSWIDLAFTTTAPASGDLSGNITESVSGDDIQGVTVTATGTTTYTTTTDASGDYLFDNIDVDTYTVSTSHASYQDASANNVAVTDGGSTVQNFVLTYKTGTYSGFVYDGTGTAVDGATVTINGQNDNTDATGAFSVTGLAPGTYSAVASKTGYASTTAASQRIGPDSTTNHNFTIYSAGVISGTVTDGTNGGTEDGVLVTVVETGDTYTTVAAHPGEFTFNLSTGTYSLTFTKTGFHDGSTSGLTVTAGNTTNADKTIYAEHWTFADGDPFSNVWTVYLNNVTGDGTALKAGDELAIYAPDERGSTTQYAPKTTGTINSIAAYKTGTITSFADAGGGNTTVTTNAAHGLSNGASLRISSTTNYNGTYTVANAAGSTFDIVAAFVADDGTGNWEDLTESVATTAAPHGLSNGDQITISGTTNYDGTYTVSNASGTTFQFAHAFNLTDAGTWVDDVTVVTSASHGRTDGQSITISGSTNYNGTFTVANKTANTFEIATTYVGNDATGKWVYGEQMVGLYYLTGPISGAGANYDLKAYSVLNDGSTGYVAGEDFTFKLSYAGGSVLTTLNSTTWTTGTGLTDPGTTYPSGSVFSMVNLDFDLPPGSLVVDFLDEGGNDPDATLNLNLKKGGVSVATYAWTGPAAYTFANLDAGDYTLVATSDRFQTTTYTGITVAPSATTTKSYVINHFADETQTINLTAGYQLISRRVDNDTYDMSDYLPTVATPVTTTHLDMTKDEDGTSDTYNPLVDGGVQWGITRGYNFKMNTADAMSITGTPIAYNADINVRAAAYSMISYLPDYTLDAEVAFASLMTDDLDFIRDRDGNSLTKVAGVWVDHIGNCTAGEGFLIKWGGAQTTFNYPASTKAANANNEEMELVHFPFYDGYGNPMSNVFTMYISGDELEVGDEVAAFDGTILVGATVIISDNALENNLNAFAELFDRSGFDNGNQIILKVWKANEDKEYWLNFENISEGENMYHGVVYPSEDGKKSTLNVTLSPNGISDNLAEYINVYPNPSNGFVTISSPEQIESLSVVNIVGQTILELQVGEGNTQLNLSEFKPGIYFVNIVVNGQRLTKKLTIQ